MQAATINDIQDQAAHAVEISEATAENLTGHIAKKNVHGATADEIPETLMFRRKDGSVSAGKPINKNDAVRLAEIEDEASTRASADQELQRNLVSETETRTEADSFLQTAIDTEAASRISADNALHSSLDTHTGDRLNPHGVTAKQAGLGNVPNVATNDQSPTYTVADSEQNLSSGEKLGTAFGKIAKTVQSFITHISSNLVHGATANNIAGTLMARSTNGTAQVASPLNDLDIANKKFVTDLLAGIGVNDVHALSENITPKIWHNGKAVYRKGFYISSLPNTAGMETAFNITGLTYVTNLFGIATEKQHRQN